MEAGPQKSDGTAKISRFYVLWFLVCVLQIVVSCILRNKATRALLQIINRDIIIIDKMADGCNTISRKLLYAFMLLEWHK